MTEDSDAASTDATHSLLSRARAGDLRAFDELFGRHRAALHRAVARRLGPSLRARIDPSDVVQDAQVEALERLDEFAGRRPMPFRVWLFRTAIQRVGKLRRHVSAARRDLGRERPMANPGDFTSTSSPVGRIAAAGPTPSQQAAARDAASRLRAVLQRLPEPDRLILGMRTFEGLSYEEVGTRLEIEPAAARKRYGRALLRLRALLLDEGLTESHLWIDT
jgi:RNA polymerase sigma-70 factor (ECF subfamily)